MTFTSALLFAASLVVAQSGQPAAECRDWQTCRQQALEAAERREYDAFYDLAWRAVQTGPKNDTALMAMLARAQSLAGRPHDSLVMLQRLAAMGVVTDAGTSDDFRRVRELPGWADFEARLSGQPAPAKKEVTPPPADSAPPPKRPVSEPVATAALAKPEPPAKSSAAGPVTFPTSGLSVVGLAYDAVSGRFIVGDREQRRLAVIGERSHHVASVGSDAGFGEIGAFEIDTREGDLWVASASGDARSSTVHKLQLISGRVLASIALPAGQGPARFADVALTPESTVVVLDSLGRRLFRVSRRGRTLELAARLAATGVVSVAPASETTVYAAYDQGLMRVDLPTRSMTVVEPGQGRDLGQLTWIRWHRGSLVGIQRSSETLYRAIRIRLDDSGRTARAVDVLEEGLTIAGPASVTLAGNVLHYLSTNSGAGEYVVKRLTLK
jgi:hypothetical protein